MSDNQCDGCARNLPLTKGIHFDGGKSFIFCTKEKYITIEEELANANTKIDRLCEALLEAADNVNEAMEWNWLDSDAPERFDCDNYRQIVKEIKDNE